MEFDNDAPIPHVKQRQRFPRMRQMKMILVASVKFKHASTQCKVPFQACYHCGVTSDICKMQKHRHCYRNIGHSDFMRQLPSHLAEVRQVYDDDSG